MKKYLFFLALACSASQALTAQSKDAFKLPNDYNYAHKVRFSLDKGNSVTVYLSDVNDIPRLKNVDSLIRRFQLDLALLKDSLGDPVERYYIEHFTDGMGVKKISFRKTLPEKSSYLVMNRELADLKTGQDTVRIIGVIPHPPKPREKKIQSQYPRYYEFVFSLNNLDDLNLYHDERIGEKLEYYAANKNSKWKNNWGEGLGWKMVKDNSITGDRPTANAYNSRDYLFLTAQVSMQNYKNYFVPGFGVGAGMVFSNLNRGWKHEVTLLWEPQFLFAKDEKDRLQLYRNDFLTLGYGQGPVLNKNPQAEASFTGVGSLGYLIHRSGDFYEKNSFRLSFGRFNWHKTSIDPLLYFHDFFQGVSPGLRIVQRF